MSDIHVRLHNSILWLLLDRQPLNPLTTAMLETLANSIHQSIKLSPRLIVITGMGEQAFCAGVDLPDDSDKQRAELLQAARNTEIAFDEFHLHRVPTVALLKGSVFGPGCELASLCDTLIARDDAVFRLPAVNAKAFPNAVSIRLPSMIGRETTDHLVQNGKTLHAHEAFRLGLVHQVISRRRFLLDTEELLVMLATVGKSA
ncbi:MAG: enoyl-CoA hydratase/isomerase family protein [Ktedonobacteraceae bacterium]|nr:enoyl-CoA hydratase/isomerase family protein [Ktedonobacteraceae bacterium]